MEKLLLALLMTGCTTDAMTEPSAPDEVVDTTIDVLTRDLCSRFETLSDRHWRELVPYIAPAELGTTAVVEGRLVPLQGSGIACVDDPENPCPDLVGNTFVNHVQELHLADGSVELGAFGNAVLEHEGWQDNPAWCEWRPAIRVLQ